MKKGQLEEKIKLITLAMVGIIILFDRIGLDSISPFVVEIGVSMMLGAITTYAASSIITSFGGGFLRKLFLSIKINGKDYSISLFVLATWILKIIIF